MSEPRQLTFDDTRTAEERSRDLPTPDEANIAYLVALLEGKDWMTAAEIIEAVRIATAVQWPDRKVRELAAQSKGLIAGGQNGYKLVRSMTADEYNHFRNWMSSQADKMRIRIIESDKIFYERKPL